MIVTGHEGFPLGWWTGSDEGHHSIGYPSLERLPFAGRSTPPIVHDDREAPHAGAAKSAASLPPEPRPRRSKPARAGRPTTVRYFLATSEADVPMTSLGGDFVAFVSSLVDRGGPAEAEYDDLTRWISRASGAVQDGSIPSDELPALLAAFGEALTPATMQGFAFRKPRGYAGDFEIIDRIYREYVSPDPRFATWDHYFHSHPAPKAVRNRIGYMHRLLDALAARGRPAHVLELGSGSGRSMHAWLERNPSAAVRFECVELDESAIEFASRLNHAHLERITFHRRNALRFQPKRNYDLIWTAGLFDYFDDRVFATVAGRLVTAVEAGGELVIGNFAPNHPSRPYMDLVGNWPLRYRDRADLARLLGASGADPSCVRVDAESEGVNLFAHYRRAS